MNFKIKSAIVLCGLLISAVAMAQVKEYQQEGNYQNSKGKRDANGNPVGEWQYYGGAFSNTRPTEYFNYDTREFRDYFIQDITTNKPLILQEKGKLNSDLKKTGTWITYHNTRKREAIHTKGNYINGVKDGQWQELYLDGSLQSVEVFENGARRGGTWKEYFEDGKLKSSMQFEDNRPNGDFSETKRFPGYSFKTYGKYKLGSKHGDWIIYCTHSKGEFIYEKAVYDAGRAVGGELKRFNEDGSILNIVSHNSKGEISESKEFYDDGTTKKISIPTASTDHNPATENTVYFKNGSLKEKYIEKKGYYYNIITMKDIEGGNTRLRYTAGCIGTFKLYDEDGQLKSIETLGSNGRRGPYSTFGSVEIDGTAYRYKEVGQIGSDGREGSFDVIIEKNGIQQTLQTDVYFRNVSINQKKYNLEGELISEFNINKSTGEKIETDYYPTGKVKTKLQKKYPNDLLNVLECKDPNGEDLDFGTIKNGTGSFKLYNIEGKLETTYILSEGKVTGEK
ncbi:hypothetical exported 24-amino acid repeat protein [Algibacter lectus]|uniref:Hypothetical exported 24-amino acid repeat protein n=2 Tax=Algibacter lectus TaxID=221126 RepID=A0A090WZL5_9FLAO|nr:hypothetical exported 24-amino acid repeat protein [Algibacter lectus]